jgi:hypothetical protein
MGQIAMVASLWWSGAVGRDVAAVGSQCPEWVVGMKAKLAWALSSAQADADHPAPGPTGHSPP